MYRVELAQGAAAVAHLAARRRARRDPGRDRDRGEGLAADRRSRRTRRRSWSRSCRTACSRRSPASPWCSRSSCPLATGLFCGDAIAGEAQAGTLRYLLVRPVGRSRLVLAKYAVGDDAARARCSWARSLAGWSPAPPCSAAAAADAVGHHAARSAAALLRIVASGLYMVRRRQRHRGRRLCSCLDAHRLGPGGHVATIVVAIASQILDNIPSLHVLHPYLPTHGWLGFTDLFRFPVDWTGCAAGCGERRLHRGVHGPRPVDFRRRDVTS